jgi:hypothetical protein
MLHEDCPECGLGGPSKPKCSRSLSTHRTWPSHHQLGALEQSQCNTTYQHGLRARRSYLRCTTVFSSPRNSSISPTWRPKHTCSKMGFAGGLKRRLAAKTVEGVEVEGRDAWLDNDDIRPLAIKDRTWTQRTYFTFWFSAVATGKTTTYTRPSDRSDHSQWQRGTAALLHSPPA